MTTKELATQKQIDYATHLLSRIPGPRLNPASVIKTTLPGCKATQFSSLTKSQMNKVIQQLTTWAYSNSKSQSQQTKRYNTKGEELASPKQKSYIQNAVERGEWFDTFDGMLGFGPSGPDEDWIQNLTKKEASKIIQDLKT